MAKKKNTDTETVVVPNNQPITNCDRFVPVSQPLKDLGKKWFAFSKMEITANELLKNMNK